jgi:dTDP-glucose pyrophosphorylase
MSIDVATLLVLPDASALDVMRRIDENVTGLALVVDDERRLLATVTDGDLRRAVLAGRDLSEPIRAVVEWKHAPVSAPVGTTSDELLELMETRGLRHVPLLDADGRVVDVALLTELVRDRELPLRAVVMAGGFGRRLGELTADVPKPMLPLADEPLLERIVAQLRDAGIGRVALTTHYRSDLIREHFGDGSSFGVDIHYVDEQEPLGTAGGLSLLEDSDEPVLVMNGDIVTRIGIDAFVAFHAEHEADLTVAVLPYEFRIPYGVVDLDGARITRLSEKPVVRRFANAGIYLLSADARRSVPRGKRCDMTELIDRLITDGRRVVAFPLREYWVDIGDVVSYERARADAGAET